MIKVMLCLFMLLGVSVNALAGFHVHDKEVTTSFSTDHEHEAPSSSSNDCDGGCFLHCGVWHILMTMERANFKVGPTIFFSDVVWALDSMTERNFIQKLWRPPAFIS